MVLLLAILAAFGGPADDPSAILAGRAARARAEAVVLGGSDRSPLELSTFLLPEEEKLNTAAIEALFGPELQVSREGSPWSGRAFRLHPRGGLVVGDLAPRGGGGDAEEGLVSLRAGVEGRAYLGALELGFAPELGLEIAPFGPLLRVADAWVGARHRGLSVGFGMRDRWIGPGRHGSLMLGDHARAAPLGSVAWRSGSSARWGQGRLEAGAGWLDGARSDVLRPGWLLMDARWALRPWLELGGTRMAIFGGVDRPPPDLLQLLLPTEPHIYGDPEQLLPDQNELAALDVRVTIPARALAARIDKDISIDYIELWWQYGGEDVIARESFGIPYPSLAGVANLLGAELGAGALSVSAEGARILDDTFRWYTGHRIYHQGFTREGRAMGHPAGGDSLSAWGAVTWLPGDLGGQLSFERRRRVGIIEATGDNLLALSTDELAHTLGIALWRRDDARWWKLGAELERVRGEDFVPGADGWSLRVALRR